MGGGGCREGVINMEKEREKKFDCFFFCLQLEPLIIKERVRGERERKRKRRREVMRGKEKRLVIKYENSFIFLFSLFCW